MDKKPTMKVVFTEAERDRLNGGILTLSVSPPYVSREEYIEHLIEDGERFIKSYEELGIYMLPNGKIFWMI